MFAGRLTSSERVLFDRIPNEYDRTPSQNLTDKFQSLFSLPFTQEKAIEEGEKDRYSIMSDTTTEDSYGSSSDGQHDINAIREAIQRQKHQNINDELDMDSSPNPYIQHLESIIDGPTRDFQALRIEESFRKLPATILPANRDQHVAANFEHSYDPSLLPDISTNDHLDLPPNFETDILPYLPDFK